ncbi:MAG TPA: hypothetical protein VFZ34_08060, partial [Blastocatellia bacterium]|nr:hypothetical protein [Blastocatellia bacterium]
MQTITKALCLCFLLAGVAAVQAQDANVTKAQELVRQAREAIGGEANLKAIQSVIVEGKFKSVMMGRPAEGNLKIEMLLPDKYL